MKKLALLCVLALLAGTACWPFSDADALGEMTIKRNKGTVVVIRDDEVYEVENEFALEVGDLVRGRGGALATLRLTGQRTAEVKGATESRIHEDRIDFEGQGGLLATAAEPMKVKFGEVTASSSNGRFRLDLGFGAARAAAYQDSVQLSAPGQGRLAVRELYQATIAANDLPETIKPIRISSDDEWDVAYLEEVVGLDESLRELALGLKAQVGRSAPKLAYFSTLADGRNVSYMKRYLRRRATDLLIGFTIADEVPGRALRAPFLRAFALYDESAGQWGVVAGIMDVRPQPLIAQLEAIIEGTGAVAAGGKAKEGDVFTVAAARAAEGGAPGGDSFSSGTEPAPTGTQEPPEEPKKPTKPRQSPSPADCDDTIDCAGNDVKEKIFPSPTPSPSSSP